VAKAGTLEIELIANLARLQQDMDKVTGTVGKAMAGVDKAAGLASKALGFVGIALSASSFASMIKGSIDAADNLNDLSKSTGLTVETLSGLKLAASQSGTQLDATAKAINFLSKGIGQNAEKYRELGITAKDPLEAFKQLADQFAATEDVQKRNALATEALGRSWESVAPLLAEGGDAIQAMVDRGMELSGITTEMARSADAYNDNVELLKSVSAGWAMTLTSSLLPALTSTSEGLLRLANNELWLELKTEQATARLEEQTEALNKMTAAQVDADLQSTFMQMQELEASIAHLTEMTSQEGPGFHNFFAGINSDKLALNNVELEKAKQHYEDLKQQLAILEGRAEATAEATDDAAGATDHYAAKVKDLIGDLENQKKMMGMSSREAFIFKEELKAIGKEATPEAIAEVRKLAGELYDLEKGLKDAADASKAAWDQMVEDVKTAGEAIAMEQEQRAERTKALNEIYAESGRAASDAAKEIVKANEQAAKQAADDWREFRDDFSDSLADMLMDGGNVFDDLAKSFERMLYKMAGDLIASGVMEFLTGTNGGFSVSGSLNASGTTGTLVNAGIKKFAPGLASSLGLGGATTVASGAAGAVAGGAATVGLAGGGTALTSAGYLSLMGGGTAAAGAGTAAAGTAAGGLTAGLAAIPVWGWVAAAAIAAGALLSEKPTPTSNSGFLLHDVPGASPDRKFNVDPFASGFQPVGFNRRGDMEASKEVIDYFRGFDSKLTELFESAGFNVNTSAATFRHIGTSETGIGDGVFIGKTAEDGDVIDNIERQANEYVDAFVQSIPGLGADVIERILGGTDAADTVRIAQIEIEKQMEAQKALAEVTEVVTDTLASMTDEIAAMNDVAQDALDSAFGGGVGEMKFSANSLDTPWINNSGRNNALANLIEFRENNFGVGRDQAEAWQQKELMEFWAERFASESGNAMYQQNFRDLGFIDGSHAGGLASVPYDGYIAELHKGERVVPASQNTGGGLNDAAMLLRRICEQMEDVVKSNSAILNRLDEINSEGVYDRGTA
jgi:hypothetical protein